MGRLRRGVRPWNHKASCSDGLRGVVILDEGSSCHDWSLYIKHLAMELGICGDFLTYMQNHQARE